MISHQRTMASRAEPESVTSDETDSLIQVLAAAPPMAPPELWTTALVAQLPADSDRARAEALLRSVGERACSLEDGALVVMAAGDDPTARAANAARAALALRDALRGARIALVSNRFRGTLADRGKALLADFAHEASVVIDDATAGLLDARFEVQIGATGNILVGNVGGQSAERSWPRFLHRLIFSGVDASVPPEEVKHVVALNAISWMLIAYITVQLVPVAAIWTPALAAVVACLLVFLASVVLALALNRSKHHLGARVALFAGTLTGIVGTATSVGSDAMIHVFLLSGIFTTFYLLPQRQLGWSIAAVLAFFGAYFWLQFFRFPNGAAPAIPATYRSFLRDLTIFVGLPAIFLFKAILYLVVMQRYDRALREARDREMKLLSDELRRQIADRARKISTALARVKTETQSFRPGTVVNERYRILRTIGEGGMGAVYEVARMADGRHLALKVLTGVVNHEALARFAREAQIVAELDHRNVVSIVDVDVSRSGTLFLVMELVKGATLADERARFGDIAWAIAVLRQIADALAAMHERGIIHRDLKPENVLVDGEIIKVADFGLARFVEDSQRAPTVPLDATRTEGRGRPLSQTGAIVGTPVYMAPELAEGGSVAGPSSDVFSLGVIAYELLATELPFSAPPVLERLKGRDATQFKPLPRWRVPPELGALVHCCLSAMPDDRPTARAVAATLDGLSG